MIDSRPIAEGLFSWPSEEPHLIGSRCDACGLVVFPTAEFCVKCSQQRLSDIELGRRGTLWTFTTQQFRPPSPPYAGNELFEPFGLGYVAIEGQCMVETRLRGQPGKAAHWARDGIADSSGANRRCRTRSRDVRICTSGLRGFD